ncbi:putative hydrophobic protein (TIGR00271 family) [Motilibacter peucedani]|uniref:Putative hydrophobic protein (TIGR00271 family) n=1 Tax=Motilibacter peucedani TaxID=598650 RepID=A0A420XM26_9ACTN|nr:DUF389 domain-containing protein [Motilibacter peucedani]RKS71466.1 putative hydrophobic protein (TIGR00271 family) [Motilibacter peucedani]
MLHLRIVSPADRTDAVVAALRAATGATNVTLTRGAALEPPGDLVQADVAREAADAVLDALCTPALLRAGSITLGSVDTALGAGVERARDEAPGEESDALVWEQLSATTGEESTLSVTFLVFLVVATLIAAVGLLTDSQVLIVGAMVLGPEFGPLAGVAVAAVRREWRSAWLSMRALLVGFPVAVAVTALGVALLDAAGQVPDAYVQGHRPLTSFVSDPDVFSVVVALLAGVAGTISLTAAKASTLVGVFISVTTVPAAAEVAAALVTGQGAQARGACVQLAVNLACIVLAAVVTLLVQEAAWGWVSRAGRSEPAGRAPAPRSASRRAPRSSSRPPGSSR